MGLAEHSGGCALPVVGGQDVLPEGRAVRVSWAGLERSRHGNQGTHSHVSISRALWRRRSRDTCGGRLEYAGTSASTSHAEG